MIWLGRYEEVRKLGEGGSGVVYLAYDKTEKIKVAIKEYKQEEIAAQEIYILKKLSHPQIPGVIESGKREGRCFIVMTYIEGESLRQYLERDEKSKYSKRANSQKSKEKIQQKLGIGLQLCEIFIYLHAQNPVIIYRDLKPDNLLITKDKKVVLLDFGAAREYKAFQSEDTVLLGTKSFAAPEQFGGRGQSDERTDIYAIGKILFRLFCSDFERDFDRANKRKMQILKSIMDTCTEEKREERFQTVQEIRQALYQMRDDSRLCGRWVRNWRRQKKGRKSHQCKKALFIFALICLAVFTYKIIDLYNYRAEVEKLDLAFMGAKTIQFEKSLEKFPYLGGEELALYWKALALAKQSGKKAERKIILSIYQRLQQIKVTKENSEELAQTAFYLAKRAFQIRVLDKEEILSQEELKSCLEKLGSEEARIYLTLIKNFYLPMEAEPENIKALLNSLWILREKKQEKEEADWEFKLWILYLYQFFDIEEERGLELIEDLDAKEAAAAYKISLYEMAVQFLAKKEESAVDTEKEKYLSEELKYINKLADSTEGETKLRWKREKLALLELILERGWSREAEALRQQIEAEYEALLLKYPKDRQTYIQYAFYLLHSRRDERRARDLYERAKQLEGGGEDALSLLWEELQEESG